MAENVARGIRWWLREEARRSRLDHNRVLDNYALARTDYQKAVDDPGNSDMKKAEGHYMRFQFVTRDMGVEDLRKNQIIARVVHHALMFVSGGFRTQAFLQSNDQATYELIRFDMGEATGLYVDEVTAVVQENVERTMASPDVDRVVAKGLVINEDILVAKRAMSAWFAANPAYLHRSLGFHTEPVQKSLEIQRAGIGLTASYVTVAAVVRGGNFGAVPVWQPESITTAASQPPVYPFGD